MPHRSGTDWQALLERLGWPMGPTEQGLYVGVAKCRGCGRTLTLHLAYRFAAPVVELPDLSGIQHAGMPCDWFLAELSKS